MNTFYYPWFAVFLLGLASLGIPNLSIAQAQHWTFEKEQSSKTLSICKANHALSYAAGLNGENSLALSSTESSLKLNADLIDFTKPFTVSFWFKKSEGGGPMPLLSLVRFNPSKNEIKKYLSLVVDNGSFYRKDDSGRYRLGEAPDIEAQEWGKASLVYGRHWAHLYLNGEVVYSFSKSELVVLFAKSPALKNKLLIGADTTQYRTFIGAIDELKIYPKAWSKEEIRTDYKKQVNSSMLDEGEAELAEQIAIDSSNLIVDTTEVEAMVDTDSIDLEISQEPIEDPDKEGPFGFSTSWEARTLDRDNRIVDTVWLTSNRFRIEAWDFDEYDEDIIQIYKNNKNHPLGNSFKLGKKKNIKSFNCELTPRGETRLIFYARDLGRLISGSTIALRVLEGGVQNGRVLRLKSTDERNAVVHFIRREAVEKPVDKLEYPDRDGYFSVRFQNKNNKRLNGKLLVEVEDGEKKTYDLNRSQFEVRLKLVEKWKNKVRLSLVDVHPDMKCELTASLLHGNKEIGKDKLNLGKSDYTYILKVRETLGRQEITIPCHANNEDQQILQLHIVDDKIPDGDRITISYQGKIILDDFTLSDTVHILPITINTEEENVLLIQANSFGRREHGRTCTAAISVYYEKDNVKNFDFALSTDMPRKQLRLVCEGRKRVEGE